MGNSCIQLKNLRKGKIMNKEAAAIYLRNEASAMFETNQELGELMWDVGSKSFMNKTSIMMEQSWKERFEQCRDAAFTKLSKPEIPLKEGIEKPDWLIKKEEDAENLLTIIRLIMQGCCTSTCDGRMIHESDVRMACVALYNICHYKEPKMSLKWLTKYK